MLCHCGCGALAPIAKKTDNKLGVRKGDSLRYIKGHNRHIAPPTVEGVRSRCLVTDSGCWEYQGAKTSRGYGQLQANNKHMMVHRFMYEAIIGAIEDGQVVRHQCDNPSCCNPEHLLVGSSSDNTQDALSRGRLSVGSGHYNSKLSDAQVESIRTSSSISEAKDLADIYGVTHSHALSIRRGSRGKYQ